MVNPLYLFIIALGTGFLLSLIDKLYRSVSLILFYATLTAMLGIAGQWLVEIMRGMEAVVIYTAGFQAPYSINLRLGMEEAVFVFLANLVGLLSAIYLFNKFRHSKVNAMVLFLMMILGINGLIMTRDMFNLFVFMEITSIATYALIGINRNTESLSAGFKYIIAGGIASSFFLIGTIYLYRLTGTLNIDSMIASKELIAGNAGFVALFLVLAAIVIELKPFPANGWALDVYQAVDSGVVAVIATASSAAMFFVIYKLMPLLNITMLDLLAGIGGITFVFSNLVGLKQKNAKRLLGYSSIAQMGLVLAALSLVMKGSCGIPPKNLLIIVVGGLFLNHFLAKAGLFWLAGLFKEQDTDKWSVIRRNPLLLFIFGSFIFALVGLPPFPGFWAKWELILYLAKSGQHFWIFTILLGSFLEAIYLIRWLISVVKDTVEQEVVLSFQKILPPVLFMIGLYNAGFLMIINYYSFNPLFFAPLMVAAFFFGIDWLPTKFKGIFTIAVIGAFAYHVVPQLDGIYQIFAVLFLGGGLIQLIATLQASGKRTGFYPFVIMMFLSLGILLKSETTLQFFYAWELMTVSSFLLILRGGKARNHSLLYILFSLAGAYFILTGFAYAFAAAGDINILSITNITAYSSVIYTFFLVGFLIKTGALGLHIWLPGSYAESEDDVSPLISSILSKAGIFGMMLVAGIFGKSLFGKIEISAALGWLGAITALIGTLMAIFQEDIKKLLAYSSMGQLGYMVLSVAMLSHLGWISALYMSFNHLFFKALLFIAIAGVISRTGTRNMCEMGGLIKRMPYSFISVLIAIIALSGVPPLSGFGSKWLLYTAGIERGWYLQTAVAFFASTIAFLYCYRLIHTIFLGQPKPKFKEIKEASLWYLIPQYILIMAIMAISMFPNLIIKPLAAAVSNYFPTTIDWNGYTVFSSLGYWNGNAVMYVTMGVFALPLIILILTQRKPQLVKQFNIVFAAERPDRPETTHVAYNFFAPYQKALGFLAYPYATRFWSAVSEWTQTVASLFRQIYTGNGQTYALHIILYVVVLYFISGGR
ncbi:MAG: proton-conducting transporter membrane subunit [bacterium]